MLLIAFLSCKDSKKLGAISNNSWSASSLDTVYKKKNCANFVNKKLSFFIIHDNKEVNLNDYEIIIETFNSLIYKGVYSKEIIVPHIKFCNDDNLSRIEVLNFYAIDKKRKMIYSWSKKSSFYLLDYTKVFVRLNAEGEQDSYRIKFDNDLLFR